MMRSGNPTLNNKVFDQSRSYGAGEKMTLQGTVNKTFIMLALLVFTASYVWGKVMQPADALGYTGETSGSGAVMPLVIGGAIVGLVFAVITMFKKQWAPVTAPLYALAEGLFIGGISAIFEKQFPGIVIQAVGLTFGTLFALLIAYRSGMIKATENFKLGVTAATGGICMLYMVSFVMSFFGGSIPLIHSSGTFGILFSLFVVVIAALNLVMDFDFIENAAEMGVPKYMEWYGAFGLMVTLVWLYIEILRLLSKLRSR
ncbi:MAG: putative YccA/Bax inhibitor family protein [Candidatus Omnitrophota bacterium]|jgi:uncharacterized YccA/Bax inhibitor family protein